MSERKSKPVTKNTIPNRPRLGLRGLGQVQVFAHNSLRTLTQQSSQKGITETENSQILLRDRTPRAAIFARPRPKISRNGHTVWPIRNGPYHHWH